MIVSHKHRFIFLKTKKTAGTSLEVVLSRFCGPEDVLTILGKDDEKWRKKTGGYPAQNWWPWRYAAQPSSWRRWFDGTRHRFKTGRYDRLHFPLEPYRQHMDAASVRARVGKTVWDRYYKFSIERNPWDKAVSTYYWKGFRVDPDMSFGEFVRCGHAMIRPRNFDIYSIDGIPRVDRVLDFSHLSRELPEVFEEIGLPGEAADLMKDTRAKSQYRPGASYREYYDEETRSIIELQFAQEIAYMGYSY